MSKLPLHDRKNIETLAVSTIFIETYDKKTNSDFQTPKLGNNPPDTISTNKEGSKLLMEITEFNELQKAAIGKRDFTTREVKPIKTLTTTLRRKTNKYEPVFRSKLF